MAILWVKVFHVFFMVAWMAGIFYLPRLFVYHSQTDNQQVRDQFKIMERRLWFFVTPFALLGLILIYMYGKEWFLVSKWLHVKIPLVLCLYVYHGYLFVLVRKFARDDPPYPTKVYRFINEAPVFLLLAVIALAITKTW